jgi:hypothetical protein
MIERSLQEYRSANFAGLDGNALNTNLKITKISTSS